MFLVKEYDTRYGGVVGEYLFRTEEGAKAKVKELIEADQERNPECYEDFFNFDVFVEWCFEEGGIDEVFRVDEIEFED